MEYLKTFLCYLGAAGLGILIALWLNGSLYQYGMPLC